VVVLFSYKILESEIMLIKDDGTLKALANRVIEDDIFFASSGVASYGVALRSIQYLRAIL
jgi:hypothetical protein